MSKILILVESPNKVATIKQLLKGTPYEKATIMASVGHISQIADNKNSYFNTGIYPGNHFKADYKIIQDKKEIVNKLKAQVALADIIYLASDPDREGEAISESLKTLLKIPESKYKRITFHEITKKAVLNALDNPRKIDEDLVDAAQSRQKLDKMVGYRLSAIARNNVQARSVGRCQSAGLKLIVDRENEILNFKVDKFFELYLYFKKHNVDFKAKYVGTDKKVIKQFDSKGACDKVINECNHNPFIIKDITSKESLEYPKLPFCTSTFQQEVSKQLGISVKNSMSCAQKLFEGINIDGNHVALTTYIRTDDTTFGPEFLPVLEKYVKENYGNKYYAPVRVGKKSDNAQEGHECLRVIDLNMTPDKLKKYVHDDQLLKVYEIIYKRTLASSMAPAVFNNTQYSIYNKDNKFILNSKELIFDGYRAVYSYKEEESGDDGVVKETFVKNEELKDTSLKAIEKQTNPPLRYTEASFIKELDKRGIGRPSTYATIVETLLSTTRNYCVVENKMIQPTDLGMKLSKFLDTSFPDIINLDYTNELEKDLDEIAKGKLKEEKFLSNFYNNLEESIKKSNLVVTPENKVCPECGAPLVVRRGKYGLFLGCSNYPKCHHIEKLKK